MCCQKHHISYDTNHALKKMFIGAFPILRHRRVNMEHTGLILYYTSTISIKNIVFYQMVTNALNDLNSPSALLYDALHGHIISSYPLRV